LPKDNTDVVLILHDSFLPLTQCRGIEVGKPFGYARFDEVNAGLELEGNFDEMHDLARTPLKGHHNVFVREESSSLGSNYIIPIPIEHSHASLMCSQPSFSPEYSIDVPKDILNFVILMLIWAMRITCLICLETMLKFFSP